MKNERDKYLLKEEYLKFIDSTPEQFKLFWKVVFNAGLRISEALSILPKDILWNENKILITTLKRKGRPVIPVIIPKDIISELQTYLTGKSITDSIWPFTRQYAWQIFKTICKKAGLNPRYSPHALRHAHGVMISDITNGNMIEIKDRLRHSSVKSTEFYVHCSEAKQKELANKINEYMK